MSDFIRLKVKFTSDKYLEKEFGIMDSIFRKESIDSIFEFNDDDKTHICMGYVEHDKKANKVIVTYEILDETMDTIMSKLEEGTNEL